VQNAEVKSNFQLFGFAHLTILCAVLLLAAVLALLQRRLPLGTKVLRFDLASVLLADALWWDGFLAWHRQL
jgi:hypothetical protein